MRKIKTFNLFKEALDNDDNFSDDQEPDMMADDEIREEEPVEDIDYEGAKAWILENYDEDRVIEMLDEAKHEYIDYKQMEQEGYESEYDYYVDYGRGEAESDVIREILTHLKSKFNLTFDETSEETDLYEFLRDVFEPLQY